MRIIILLLLSFLFAESVTLKSGERIYGFINFRDQSFITIESEGIDYVIPMKNVKEIEFCSNYLRMKNGDLQVKNVTLEKNGKLFSICSLVHVGNRSFYRRVESNLNKNQVVLYESFGNRINTDLSTFKIPKKKYFNEPMRYESHNSFHEIAKLMGLKSQTSEMIVDKPFWIASDLSQKEFNKLYKKRKFDDFFENMTKIVDPNEIRRVQYISYILHKVISDPNDKLLRKYALTILAEDIVMNENVAPNTYMKCVLIDRNARVLEDIYECLRNKDLSRIGINFGAYHTSGIVKDLIKNGFTWVEESWTTAWRIE